MFLPEKGMADYLFRQAIVELFCILLFYLISQKKLRLLLYMEVTNKINYFFAYINKCREVNIYLEIVFNSTYNPVNKKTRFSRALKFSV